MNVNSFGILIGLIMALAFIIFTSLIIGAYRDAHSNWQVEATLYGQVHVLDENLTYLQCLGDIQERRKRWGSNVRFACTQMPEETAS